MVTSPILTVKPTAQAVADDNSPRHISNFFAALLARYGIHPDALRAELDRQTRPVRRQITASADRSDLVVTAKFNRGSPVSHAAMQHVQTQFEPKPIESTADRKSLPTTIGQADPMQSKPNDSTDSTVRQSRRRPAVQLTLFGGSAANSSGTFASR
ncbi:MAG TPA: hypothetical protein VGJ15_13990 [Pirellulales bacterium]|jgi:hypothetical protein